MRGEKRFGEVDHTNRTDENIYSLLTLQLFNTMPLTISLPHKAEPLPLSVVLEEVLKDLTLHFHKVGGLAKDRLKMNGFNF